MRLLARPRTALDLPAATPAPDVSLLIAEQRSPDPLTARARPLFLYVMYALLLWAIPVGLVAAFRPHVAQAMAVATGAYLSAIPEPLYALFATGYLGYTVARQWGKAQGTDR